jgi:malate dehydrogenase (oxaloacetate-decarboxylating)(NADP+)
MDSGVARRPIADIEGYKARLSARLDPAAGFINSIFDALRLRPKRVVFAEAEEEQVVRAASSFADLKLGHPILIGRESQVHNAFHLTGIANADSFEIVNSAKSPHSKDYAEFLYQRLQRKGYLYRDCLRLVNFDRNIFGACMLALGHADAMVTGVTRNWATAFNDVRRVLDPKENRRIIGVSVIIAKGRVIFVADTSIHAMPTAEELADIAVEAAGVASRFGIAPRVAMLSYSTFGQPATERAERIREAVAILGERGADFEFDGDMGADVALNRRAMAQYPFCRLSGTANVLVMPAFHAASISTKMLQELGGGTVIGPMLVGLSKPVQIAALGSSDSDLVNMAALAAFDVTG